jgi:DNA-binding NarL/FixJ family response regulator
MTFFYPAVLVAAEPSLYRTGLVALLQEQWPSLPLVLTADTSQLIDLVQQQAFQVLILDGSLPGRMLPGLLQRLYQARPSQRMLVLEAGGQPQLTTQPASPQVLVPRHTAPNRLAATLAPWLGETTCLGQPARSLRPIPTRFSPRELEVLRLVVDDRCNREIADSLYLSVRTIESHRRALLQKSGTRTLVGLVAWALREGMVA